MYVFIHIYSAVQIFIAMDKQKHLHIFLWKRENIYLKYILYMFHALNEYLWTTNYFGFAQLSHPFPVCFISCIISYHSLYLYIFFYHLPF